MTPESGKVLVVDDDDAFRRMLSARLRDYGYETAEAASGTEALAIAHANPPDAVILDVLMPGMSGHEVCVKLKAHPETAMIPVLMMTSTMARQDRLRGIEAGADDYLVKPFDPDELRLRARNAIRVRSLLRQAQDDSTQIKQLESLRDELTQLIVRDMKTPLAGLAGLLELADRAAVKHLDNETSFYLNEALGATETLEELVDSLMDVRRLMAGELTLALHACDVAHLAGVCAELLKDAAVAAGVTITVSGKALPMACDETLIRRVLQHLLRHAVKRSSRGQPVEVSVAPAEDRAVITITDHGRPLDAAELGTIRQWFRGQMPGTEDPATGRLGMTFCRLVIAAHGGDIDLTSSTQGTTVQLRLPVGGATAADTPAAAPLAANDGRSRRYIAGRRTGDTPPGARTLSLAGLGTRARFGVAVSLMSVLPLLAFMVLLINGLRNESVSQEAFYFVTPAIVVLVVLGIVLLIRHSRQVEQLRRTLEVMAHGGVPSLMFGEGGEDFLAIEKCLGAVIRQTDDRVRVIEAQSRALVQAEQQRVMIETLGAACHHLGQPATVIRVYLEMMQKKESSPEMQRMIGECQSAAESVAGILHRLQGVGRYQTEPYLQSRVTDEAGHEGRILKI
jgi:signal transduction histidine kinase